ncbi:hydroxysqualene dehydroxylase [Nocardia asteroides]|uniref:hydroxysqualene dehydroxylase n=1 Tax=Nocardia asteroides TaxID=1824 RepID=UPI001E6420EF|nr:FAD-dependent oxidoreductase [Nocardia asteroides]UGT61396.1 FAD-dependent oxidoreductase [Nocardia asteroides]
MTGSGVTRRNVLRGMAAGTAALAAAGGLAHAAPAEGRVAVLGGGIAGLTAAHELAERGFEVTVYERRALGGKARSMAATTMPTAGGRRPLPGEHGFRFFPGFYQAVPDTMRRIPFPGNRNGVRDNLVPALTATGAYPGPEITAPFALDFDAIGLAANPERVVKTMLGGLIYAPKLPYLDLLGLAQRVTRTLVAAKENIASARTMGNMAEAFLLNLIGRGAQGFPDMVLNAPTNEAWIDPWVAHLGDLGVRFEVGARAESLTVGDGRVGAAVIDGREVEADWFVLAVPPEHVVPLLGPEVLGIDPALERISKLFVDWMTGIQFYLDTDRPMAPGHIGFIESPWRLTAIQQGQFWHGRDIARDYGDGTVRDILSVDISDWGIPGPLTGKPARECSPEEIARETWHQVVTTTSGRLLLPDQLTNANLRGWFLDPGIGWNPETGTLTNDDPLLINTAGSWDNRPNAATGVPNLFLAGDYCRSQIDLATMESANEGGRNAANAILDAAGSDAPRARLWPHVTIAEFDAARDLDRVRWRAGQPNLLDLP